MAIDVATTAKMAKSLSSLIQGVDDTKLQNGVTEHAIPRIKLYLLASVDAAGNQIFYSQLSDMADGERQSAAEQLVDAVFDEAIISAGLQRVAAAYTAAWTILSEVGIIESQQKIAIHLEKMATQDLDRLVKNKVVSKAVESALPKLTLGSDVLYMANDLDETTVDTASATGSPVAGAKVPGKVTAIINGFACEALVDVGDNSAVVLDKLARAIAAAQGTDSVNISAAPNEGAILPGTRKYTFTDLAGTQTIEVSYLTNVSSIAFKPWKLDNTVDMAVVTLYLSHPDADNPGQYLPGIEGLLFGTSQQFGRMSKLGPYSAVVDLHTGKTTAISTANGDESKLVSDSLFFEVVPGGTTADGSIKYQVNGSPEQTVAVPAGTDAQGLVELLAQDLGTKAATQRVLGAVRPSSKITVNGTAKQAPGLELVGFQASASTAKMVFQVNEVPAGVSFGVVPSTLITQNTFDAEAKSVVLSLVMKSSSYMAGDTGMVGVTPTINAVNAPHQPSPQLQGILDLIKLRRGS